MKSKLCILTLLGLVACQMAGWAQNSPSGNDAQPSPTEATDNVAPATPDPAMADPAAAPEAGDAAPAPGSEPAADPAAPASDPAASEVAAAEAAPADAAAEPVVATDAEPVPAEKGAIIPLIVMDDVPLTDAIKNLARQAGLNYMLDPKIGYGQVGPDGKPTPQPTVSIRWENVSAEQALNTLLGNYSLQLVEDPKSKIARVTIKDPAAPDPLVTQIIQLKFASPSNITSAVQSTLTDKRSKVVADVRTSQLVVLATEKEMVEIDKLVERLDTQTRQVLIEARLMETTINPKTVKGLDWTGTLNEQNIRFGNNGVAQPRNVPRDPLGSPGVLYDTLRGFNPSTAFLDADGFSAVLSFLNTSSDSKVLSAPRTVTLDNELASITVTRAVPIFRNTAGTQGSPGGSEILYTNLGVILNVTPRISANNFVNLRVVPEVSRVFDTAQKIINDEVSEADIYDIRRIDTHVMIPSGNTLVLGGLVQDDLRESNVKVPVLGDIPGLGYLFRKDSRERSKQNLLIFITPTIVGDGDYQPTQTDFLKTPVPLQDSVDKDWTWWDEGKPRDWSKPAAGGGDFGPLPEEMQN